MALPLAIPATLPRISNTSSSAYPIAGLVPKTPDPTLSLLQWLLRCRCLVVGFQGR